MKKGIVENEQGGHENPEDAALTHAGKMKQKAEQVEPGIWKHAKGKGYLVEVSYRDPKTGKRIREQKSINRLDLAREWIQTRKADALRDEIRGRDKIVPRPFSAFADEYLEKWSQVKKKSSSYDRDRMTVRAHLKPYFGNEPIHAISRKDVEDYIVKRRLTGVSVATCNRELCCLKNMLKKGVDWEYIEANPAERVRQEREYPKEANFLTREEIPRLLAECNSRIRPFVEIALNTGLRKGELYHLEWRDADLESRMITVRDSKNHETRHVPMNEAVHQTLSRHPRVIVKGKACPLVFANPDGTPYRDIRTAFTTALKGAKITRHIRIHDLRHTFASHLVMAGVDMRTVGKLMGHRVLQVTMRYAHLAPDHLKATVERLDFSMSKEERQEYKVA